VLSVLIPCLDEAEGLPRLEAELFDALAGVPAEILAIDDGSTDATGKLLREMAERRPGMRVFAHGANRGIGACLKTALDAARGDWLVLLDADLTFHPRHIPALQAVQEETGADCVCGSPFLGDMTAVPLGRRIPSLAVNLAYRLFFDAGLSAYTPMFRLYRASALRAVDFQSEGFQVSAEIAVRMLKAGFKVVDAPVQLTARRSGESKLQGARELKSHIKLIFQLLRTPSAAAGWNV
jgi:glycosyltransferase involved in cell wall biosynthesis